MKVNCRSILVRGSQRISNVSIRKTYDMSSVQSHEFDLPVYSSASFYLYLPLAFLMAAAGVCGMCLFPVGFGMALYHRDDTQALMTPLYLVPFFGLGLALILWLTWKFSVGKIKEVLVEEAVRKARGLDLGSTFEVIEEREWESFLKRLK